MPKQKSNFAIRYFQNHELLNHSPQVDEVNFYCGTKFRQKHLISPKNLLAVSIVRKISLKNPVPATRFFDATVGGLCAVLNPREKK
jgi:hypothetical protein